MHLVKARMTSCSVTSLGSRSRASRMLLFYAGGATRQVLSSRARAAKTATASWPGLANMGVSLEGGRVKMLIMHWTRGIQISLCGLMSSDEVVHKHSFTTKRNRSEEEATLRGTA